MSEQNIGQRFICVWLDNRTNRPKDYVDAQDDLRTIVDSFRNFNDLNKCVDFIFNMDHVKIIFIALNVFAKDIIPIIHSCEQIHSIYIYNLNTNIEKQWTKNYEKIKGIDNDMKLICQKIKGKPSQSVERPTQPKQNTTGKTVQPKHHSTPKSTQPVNDPVGISFVSSADMNSRDVNRQDPSFMYSQLLKEIILNDNEAEKENETKEDMLTFCRNVYVDNQFTLDVLNEFEKDFLPELSIYWYTRECFLYRMLNKALWTPQPDVLYKLRYFIRHLHQQILAQAKLQRTDRSSIIVYRGQNMSMNEIERIKQNKGGFLSFNNFLSTSLKRNVSLNFLWGLETGVLFEIFIDTTIKKFPFVNVEHLSFQQGPDTENELLFSMGTVFRIVGIDTEKGFYRVQLMLSNDGDEQLAEYTKRTREETKSSCSFLSLLKMMYQLGQYNYVDRFVEIFDNDCPITDSAALRDSVHNIFGLIYHDRGQLKDALEHFHKSLNICLETLSADHPRLAVTYNNIACVYSSQSDYGTALTFHKLALDCQTNSDNPNVSSIITYTNNIAGIYYHQEKYKEALDYHKRVLELQKQFLGENHPSLTQTYSSISTISYKMNDFEQTTKYHEKAAALQSDIAQLDPEASAQFSLTTGGFCLSQGEYKKALEYFNQALQTQQQYLLPNNPALVTTYNCIANVYYQQEQFEEALSYHQTALKVQQHALANDHPSIATSYRSISKDYAGLLLWSDALEYGLKAIEQIKKSSQADVDTLSSLTDHVGHLYYQHEEYEQALTYYKQALDLSYTYLPDDDASLIGINYRTANTYLKLERYDEALQFYQKTLSAELKTLPDNAKTIADTYGSISIVYFCLKQLDEAFNAADQALEQMLKTLPYNDREVVQQRAFLDAIKIKQMIEEQDHLE